MVTSARRRPAAAAARVRKLHRDHFAFYRGLLEGLPLEAVWDRYMSVEGERTDLRLVPATVAWIRGEFAAAAKREHKPGTARLLRLDVQRLADETAVLPSLAQFAEEAGLEDEREADQMAAYQERYGRATARQRGRARLLKRQLAALRWLEAAVAQDPAPGDAVASWLRPELARFLEAVDIFTLAHLAQRIQGLGQGWARSIKGIGPLKAQRITRWVMEHAGSIGVPVGPHAVQARHQVPQAAREAIMAPATDIRPLEKLIVPAELDGRQGRSRRPQEQCLLLADNDYDAVLAWLRSKHGQSMRTGAVAAAGAEPGGPDRALPTTLSNTQRSYRKEAERFLLWAIVERGKPLSSMASEDCMAYMAFLADPQPRSRWCGQRSRERWSPLWRPFEGPLSLVAQRQAQSILRNLYGFLNTANYLSGNPWTTLPAVRGGRMRLDASRSLTREQWGLVRDRAAAGQHSTAVRLRLALDLLYYTGLRAQEAVQAKVGDLVHSEFFDADAQERVAGWMLHVVGKGGRAREVPVPDKLVARIQDYLQHRGLPANVLAPTVQAACILGSAADVGARAGALVQGQVFDPLAGVSESTLYRQLKAHFVACAQELRATGDPSGADRLTRASTHWLRHTHASHALARGVKLQEAQQNLGHASLATTTAYVTTESAQRLKSMRGLWSQETAL